jgi:hypothetical protein
VFSNHKFAKNSSVIPNHRNFTAVMAIVCRIFFCLLPILFFNATASATALKGTSFTLVSREFNPFEENGKFGLKNTKGEVIIPAQYEKLGWSDGKFSVVENVIGYQLKGNWGLITIDNEKITKAEFTDLSPGQGSVIVARKKIENSVKVLTGCINTSGKIVVPFQYDGLSVSSSRAIVFEKNGIQFRHGLIDFTNRVIIPLKYQSIYPLGSLRYAVVSFANKTAIFSEEGIQLSEFLIDSISSFRKDLAIIYQNQRQGMINRSGDIVVQPIYREIVFDHDGTIHKKMADSWLFLEGDNKLIQQLNADSLSCIEPELFKVIRSGRTILVNHKLQPLNDISFSTIGKFEKGRAMFTDNGKTGIVRKDGTIVIPATYEKLIPQNNFFLAETLSEGHSQWMLIDSVGKIISSKRYASIGNFNGKFFPIQYKGYWGGLNQNGKEIIACVHDSLVQSLEDFIIVKFKGQYGIIDIKEDWIITPQLNRLKLVSGKRYIEFAKPNQILKSLTGEIIYFTENRIETSNDHLLEYLPSGGVWKIDMKGVITDRYSKPEGVENIFEESEGYRAIEKDGRFGFIDSRSRLRIANRYENVKKFSEGLAPAMILGKWGFINKEDKIAIQPVYEDVSLFKNGRSVVKQKGLYGIIDKNGKLILPVRYEQVEILGSNRIKIKQNGLIGLTDDLGKIILNPKYNSVEDLNNGFIIVKREENFGVVTADGISTIPLIYDMITYDKFHNHYLALKKSEWESIK